MNMTSSCDKRSGRSAAELLQSVDGKLRRSTALASRSASRRLLPPSLVLGDTEDEWKHDEKDDRRSDPEDV
jgi:hypothetical protein